MGDLEHIVTALACLSVALAGLALALLGRLRRAGAAARTAGREEALRRELEVGFRRAMEVAPGALVLTDAAGRIQLVNGEAERCFGYRREELEGEPVERLVPAPLRARHPGWVAGFMQHPRPLALHSRRELHGQRRDGALFPVEIRLNPIQTSAGMLVLASVLDITERKRAERALRQKTRELERSNRELAEFASVVSHDLKSPLRGIASLAEWIASDYSGVLDEEGLHQLDLLRDRTVRLHRMIEGILEYSRAGQGAEERAPVDTLEVLRGVVDVLAPPPNVAFRIEEPLPGCYCNEIQLAQIFQNLISNAIQHLGKPAGEIRVSGRVVEDRAEFSVQDTGVGIAPEHHARVFRIFQTLGGDSKGRSTGIGLSIVQKIVEFNGGELRMESTPGQGTIFHFSMPAGR